MDEEGSYANIRDVPGIKEIIGTTLVDITESEKNEKPAVMFLFSNGTLITVTLTTPTTLGVDALAFYRE